MTINFEPSTANGIIKAPSSKSFSHRMLICAALAGKSVINNVLDCDDTEATLNCLRELGIDFDKENNVITFNGQVDYSDKNRVFYCNESASTLRFMIPLVLVFGKKAVFKGKKHLIERGADVYEKAFAEKGIEVEKNDDSISFKGKLVSGEYIISGNISSQYVSGLMMALPLLEGDSFIKVLPPVESRPYIDLTLSVLKEFGIEICETEKNLFRIKGNQKYKPCSKFVEGDWSNTAFLVSLNYFGGNIKIDGLNYKSIQGDKVCLEYFDKLDKEFSVIDISDYPDLGPVLFAFASAKNGGKFIGTKRLKNKESDRVFAMAEELKKFGIQTEIEENSFTVIKGNIKKPSEILFGHNDHRIVMALSILLCITGGSICGAEAVSKSYPDFFDTLENIGIKITIPDNEEII